MITLLAKKFLSNATNYESPEVRQNYGILCGAVGIFLNILLFAGKFFAGTLSHSIAITADAFNNLSDAGSSLITLVGFRMAGQKPDPEHPFGHGRIEYISGFLVSIAIILMAVELVQSSVKKILHPEDTFLSPLIFFLLLLSILVKLYMCYYNRTTAKKIESTAMEATAMDSLSDSMATTVVLLSSIFTHFTGIVIDGWCGIAVGLFIFYAGFQAAKDTISPLLGQPPTAAFVAHIRSIVASAPEVLGIHDLIVHNYGPGRVMISLHAEVPATGDIMELHDTIDCLEKKLRDELHCEAVIHMDPILNDDEETKEFKSLAQSIIQTIDPALSLHDFRIVKGPTHTNLIFDLVKPFGFSLTDSELREKISEAIAAKQSDLFVVMEIDTDYATGL